VHLAELHGGARLPCAHELCRGALTRSAARNAGQSWVETLIQYFCSIRIMPSARFRGGQHVMSPCCATPAISRSVERARLVGYQHPRQTTRPD
jgi:hypothetical protein